MLEQEVVTNFSLYYELWLQELVCLKGYQINTLYFAFRATSLHKRFAKADTTIFSASKADVPNKSFCFRYEKNAVDVFI